MRVSPLSLSMLSTYKRMSLISDTFNFHNGLNKFRCTVVKICFRRWTIYKWEGKNSLYWIIRFNGDNRHAACYKWPIVQRPRYTTGPGFNPRKKATRPIYHLTYEWIQAEIFSKISFVTSYTGTSTFRHFCVHLLSTMLHLWWNFKQSQNAFNFTFILQMRF